MKQLKFVLLTSMLSVLMVSCGAGKSYSYNKKFDFGKAGKTARKEARKYEKQGYAVFPGKPPIENQLNSAYAKQSEIDDNGFPRWIVANGSSVAATQQASQMQAIEMAKNNLVALIESNMKNVVESDVSNNQLSNEEAVSVTNSIMVSVNKVSKKLGVVSPLFQAYRRLENGNYEVQMLVGYNYEMVKNQILADMQTQLQWETDMVREKYEKYLNPELD
jgi:hypothetical protein